MKARYFFLLISTIFVLNCAPGNVRGFLDFIEPYCDGTYDIQGLKIYPRNGYFEISCDMTIHSYWLRVYNLNGAQLAETTIAAGVSLDQEDLLSAVAFANFTTYRVVLTPIIPDSTIEGRSVELTVTPGVVFVDPGRSTDGGGSCWDDASNSIPAAVARAVALNIGTKAQVRVCTGIFAATHMSLSGGGISGVTNVALIGGCAKTVALSETGRTAFQANPAVPIQTIFDFYNISNSNLEVRNFEFHDASSGVDYSGAAVYGSSFSGTVFRNCIFEGNSADEQGGAIYVSSLQGTLGFFDCEFRENEADNVDYAGGAVSIPSGGGNTLEFSDCRFEQNNGAGNGGAISTYNVNLKLTDCIFESNISDAEGGAVYLSSAVVGTIIDNCVFQGNNASTEGGAVNFYNTDVDIVIRKTVFSTNTADSSGGAVSCAVSAAASYLLDISTSVFHDNFAATGKQIYIPGLFCHRLQATYCTFASIDQDDSGYGIYFGASGLSNVFAGCMFYAQNINNNLVRNEGSGTNYYSYCISNRPLQTPYFWFGGGSNSYMSSLSLEIATPLLAVPSSPLGPDGVWKTQDDGLRLGQILDFEDLIDAIPGMVTINGSSFYYSNYSTDITGRARPHATNGGTAYGDAGAYEYYP